MTFPTKFSTKLIKILRLSLGLFSISAASQAATITFDAGDPIGGLANGAILSNQYAGIGVTFSSSPFAGTFNPVTNDVFVSNTGMRISNSTGPSPLGTPSLVSGKFLRSINDWGGEQGDPSILAVFSTPISFLSADFGGIGDAAVSRILAYDASNNLLATATATQTAGTSQETLSVSSATPFSHVVFTPGSFSDFVVIDNITFTATAVPFEFSPALGLAGLGAITILKKLNKLRRSQSLFKS